MTGWGGWPVVGEDASFDRAQALLREAELAMGCRSSRPRNVACG